MRDSSLNGVKNRITKNFDMRTQGDLWMDAVILEYVARTGRTMPTNEQFMRDMYISTHGFLPDEAAERIEKLLETN